MLSVVDVEKSQALCRKVVKLSVAISCKCLIRRHAKSQGMCRATPFVMPEYKLEQSNRNLNQSRYRASLIIFHFLFDKEKRTYASCSWRRVRIAFAAKKATDVGDQAHYGPTNADTRPYALSKPGLFTRIAAALWMTTDTKLGHPYVTRFSAGFRVPRNKSGPLNF